MFCKKGSTSKSAISPESLPPTADAEGYHSLCAYHQVQTWRGSKKFDALKLVWKVQKGMMIAIPILQRPAQPELLKIFRCNCGTGCKTLRCTCVKHGLKCK